MAASGRSNAKARVHVALLRGVNVGGKNKLPMKELAAMFAETGCGEVRTYIQSGNVVFRAGEALARRVPVGIAGAISERFGLQVPVVTRTVDEMRAVVRHNPFLRAGADANTLHVAFLAERPSPARVAALDPDRSPPDQFAVRGRDVYLHLPNGGARSKLTSAYFDARLATVSTVRNWRTVLALLALAEA